MAMPYDTPVPGFNNNVREDVKQRHMPLHDCLGREHPSIVECQGCTEIQLSILFVAFSSCALDCMSSSHFYSVNDGDYLNAVSDQSLAENVTRVLYPNDNVNPFPCPDGRA